MRACLSARQVPQRAHVVQPVGELDDDDPDVLGHGQEHLPDVLGLLLLHRPRGAELRELGHAVDQARRPRARSASRCPWIVMSVSSGTSWSSAAARVSASICEAGEVVGHLHRMADVRLARCPQLALVRGSAATVVGTLDQADVDARPMPPRLGDDVLDRMGRLGRACVRAMRCTTAAGAARRRARST